jgi:hypothetical protein
MLRLALGSAGCFFQVKAGPKKQKDFACARGDGIASGSTAIKSIEILIQHRYSSIVKESARG